MNIQILGVGKIKTAYYDQAIQEYEKRLSRWSKIIWKIIPTSDKRTESAGLLRALPNDSFVILLDERGTQWSTQEVAQKIETLQNQGTQTVVFILGGAHGVDQTVRNRADHTWCLSELIFPHEMVRLILIEQLYRAFDLNHGGKYHHV